MEDYDLEQHLQRLCNAVGGYDTATNVYILGVEGVECLRDIKKLLRLDDKTPDRFLLRKLGEWQFVKQDLLSILQVNSERRVLEAVLELLVPLTWPLSPEVTMQCAVEQQQYHIQYKQQLTCFIDIFIPVLVELLAVSDRKQADANVVKMILTLVRNLLLIRETKDTMKDQQTHDWLLQQLQLVHFPEILVTMISSVEKENDLQLLDLLWTVLCSRKYSVSQLLSDEVVRAPVVQEVKKPLVSRPPTFKGNFVVIQNNTKHIVNNPDTSKALRDAMDKGKKKSRAISRKQQAKITEVKAECSFTETQFIVGLMSELLKGPFNLLSSVVRKNMVRERDDYTLDVYMHYFQIVTFMLRYFCAIVQDGSDVKFSAVADVLNVPYLLQCIKYIMQYQDTKEWTHAVAVLDLFFELLVTVDLMSTSKGEDESGVADSILSNLFTRIDHLKEVTKCLTTPTKDVTLMAAALKSNHQLLKVVERYNKDNDLIVVKKVRRRQNDENDNAPSKKPSIKELPFEFSSFEKEYCTEQTVQVCITLLKKDLESKQVQLEDKSIRYVAAMLHRIAVNAKQMPLLFKLDIIVVFEAVLKDRNELMRRCQYYKDLVGLIRYVTQGFFAKLKDYPLLFVEVLFPKHKPDVRRITDGLEETLSEPVITKKRTLDDVDIITGDNGYYSEDSVVAPQVDAQQEDKQPSSEIMFEVIEGSDDEERVNSSPQLFVPKARMVISDDEE